MIIRLAMRILSQPAMDVYRGEEIQPGLNVTSDEAIDESGLSKMLKVLYHPSCGYRLGADDDPVACR